MPMGLCRLNIQVVDDTYSWEECAPGPPSARRIKAKNGSAQSGSKALASEKDNCDRMLYKEIVSELATELLGKPKFGVDMYSS